MTDISVYSVDAQGVVTFSLTNVSRQISGPEAALQIAAYHLLTSPNTSTYDDAEGGGLKALMSGNMRSTAEIQTDAAIAVSRALTNIKNTQNTDRPADETIIGLRLLAVKAEVDEIKITIRVDLLDGNSFQMTLKVP